MSFFISIFIFTKYLFCIFSKFFLFPPVRVSSLDKKKRRFNEVCSDSDEEELLGGSAQPLLNEKIESGTKKGINVNLNLSPPDEPVRGKIQPFIVYVGRSIYIETKQFRGKTYVSLFRCDEGSSDPKNRFNVEVSQITTLKQALSAIESHIKKTK